MSLNTPLIVNKVTIKGATQAELMFGPVQAAILKAVLDCMHERVLPLGAENELLMIASVYMHGNTSGKRSVRLQLRIG